MTDLIRRCGNAMSPEYNGQIARFDLPRELARELLARVIELEKEKADDSKDRDAVHKV